MCGIVGLIDKMAAGVSPELLAAMRDVMVERGPDGEGHFLDGPVAMAMRRLSIIDIEGGWQPFFGNEGQYVAFQNGEIYNHVDLRKRLKSSGYKFKSESDTEVLAHGFAEWGIEGLLSRLDGMYAIAILDRTRRELHLARDRFGEKPLFYTFAQGRFAYSSNLLVLAALPWVQDEIDAESLSRYLALHYVPGEATIVKSIKRVLPGERLVVSIDNPLPRRYSYYSVDLSRQSKESDDELSQLIEGAVESRLVADVPVGVFLSGGLDSSLVAAIAAKKKPNIATFSMGFKSSDHDESPFADQVAKVIGSQHHHFVFDEEAFRTLLPKVVLALDEPVGDQAQLPLYWLCQEARQHVTVALAGEGADEIFAGYSYYRNHLSHGSFGDRIKALFGRANANGTGLERLIDNPEPSSPSGFPLLTDIAGRAQLTGKTAVGPDEWESMVLNRLASSRNSLLRASATDLMTWLPDDLLVKFDRMAMAHSLEGRAPYLDPKVAQAGLTLPPAQRMTSETSKVSLRRVARKWLPLEILERPKKGFVLPMADWMAQWFAENGPIQNYFAARPIPGLDPLEVSKVVEEDLKAGVRRERLLFALVLLVEWYQVFTAKRNQLRRQYTEAVDSDMCSLISQDSR